MAAKNREGRTGARAGEGIETLKNRNINAAGDRVSVSDLILSELGKQTATTSGGGRAALEADNEPNTHLIDSAQGERGGERDEDESMMMMSFWHLMRTKCLIN